MDALDSKDAKKFEKEEAMIDNLGSIYIVAMLSK